MIMTSLISLIKAALIVPSDVGAFWLSGWLYRKSHVINAAAGAGDHYQIRLRTFYDLQHDNLIDSQASNTREAMTYGIIGNELFWSHGWAVNLKGYVYKTNLTTLATTLLHTGNYFTMWLGVVDGSVIWAAGQEYNAVGQTASLARITTDGITVIHHLSTDDCNEFVAIYDDGDRLIVGERVIGGASGHSSWPNGGGLWTIPKATYNDTGTWSRVHEDPDHYGWISIVKFGSTYYAYLNNCTNGRWKVKRSTDLVNWTTDLDYTAQTLSDIRGMIIKAGTSLVVLAPKGADGKYHMWVLSSEGGSWTDYDLTLAFPSESGAIYGWWDSHISYIVFETILAASHLHNLYRVKLDNTDLRTVKTSITGGWVENMHSQHYEYTTLNYATYYPVCYLTSSTSRIRYVRTEAFGDVLPLLGRARTDFGDLRFTDDDGVTLLDYWMEAKVDSDYANFWIEVLDDLSTSNATIYVYYGNASATSLSNGPATFLFFDDFATDTTANYTKAAFKGPNGLAPTVTWNSAGYLEITMTTVGKAGTVTRTGTSYGAGYAIDGKVKISNQANVQVGSCIAGSTNDLIAVGSSYISLPTYDRYIRILKGSGGAEQNLAYSWTYGYDWANWHVLSLAVTSSTVKMYIDYAEKLSAAFTMESGRVGFFAYIGDSLTYKVYGDELKVRKFTYPEPTHGSWGE